MKILEKYDGSKTYMFPNGSLATPEIMKAKFPAVMAFAHVIETDEGGEVCFAVENLSALKSIYNIDRSLSENDAISAIQEIINAPVLENTTSVSSAEERIASALEAINARNDTIDSLTNRINELEKQISSTSV